MPANDEKDTAQVLKVIIYSHKRTVREQIRMTLGKRIAADLPELEISEFATYAAAIKALQTESFDAAVFDGEAVPGGMGLTRQIKDEIPDSPPVLLIIAREADAWLAAWSKAEAIATYPIDPLQLPTKLAEIVRNRRAGLPGPLHAEFVPPGVASRHRESAE